MINYMTRRKLQNPSLLSRLVNRSYPYKQAKVKEQNKQKHYKKREEESYSGKQVLGIMQSVMGIAYCVGYIHALQPFIQSMEDAKKAQSELENMLKHEKEKAKKVLSKSFYDDTQKYLQSIKK